MCSWCLGWCPCSTGRAAGAGGVSPSGGSERGNTRPALAPSSIPAAPPALSINFSPALLNPQADCLKEKGIDRG